MNKKQVIERIQEYLTGELQDLAQASAEAGDNQIDAQKDIAARRFELERLQTLYRFMPVRDYTKDDVVVPSALVSLEFDGREAFYFLAPQGGGLITQIDGKPLQVITPNSPLGEALLGKRLGDAVEVGIRGTVRRYRITSLI